MKKFETEAQRMQKLLESETYDPNALIDYLISLVGAKSDRSFCKAAGIHPSLLSRVRHKQKGVSPELLLKLHDATGVSIKEMKRIMGC